MHYLLIGGAVVLCYAAWRLRVLIRKERAAGLVPLSELEGKLRFIRDVCDGNLKRADALLAEKQEIDPALSYEQAVDLVYADMLELTLEELNALEEHAQRRVA